MEMYMYYVICVHEDIHVICYICTWRCICVLSDIIRWIYPCSMWYIYVKIHMCHVIGWHVDIDVSCIMLIWRHTCVMQCIYMKTYMRYEIYLHGGIQELTIYLHYILCNLCIWRYTCIMWYTNMKKSAYIM